MKMFLILLGLMSCSKMTELQIVSKVTGKEIQDKVVEAEDDMQLKGYLRDLIASGGITTEVLTTVLEDGGTILHSTLRKGMTESFLLLWGWIQSFEIPGTELVETAISLLDNEKRSLLSTSFAFSPLSFPYILLDISPVMKRFADAGWTRSIMRSMNTKPHALGEPQERRVGSFNSLAVNLYLLSAGNFNHITDKTELCKRNIKALVKIIGRANFYRCFLSDKQDLHLVFSTLPAIMDSSISKYLLSSFWEDIGRKDLYLAMMGCGGNLLAKAISYQNWHLIDSVMEHISPYIKQASEYDKETMAREILSACGGKPSSWLSELIANEGLFRLGPLLKDLGLVSKRLGNSAIRSGEESTSPEPAMEVATGAETADITSLRMGTGIPSPEVAQEQKALSSMFCCSASPHYSASDLGPRAGIFHTIRMEDLQALEVWLSMPRNRAGIDERNDKGETPLIFAANVGNANVFNLLLGAGADASARDRSGWTPLMHAASRGHSNLCRIIIGLPKGRSTLNLSGRDNKMTALELAVGNGHLNVVLILLAARAKVNHRGRLLEYVAQASSSPEWDKKANITKIRDIAMSLGIASPKLNKVYNEGEFAESASGFATPSPYEETALTPNANESYGPAASRYPSEITTPYSSSYYTPERSKPDSPFGTEEKK